MDRSLSALQQEISAVTSGMTPEQISWHPAGKWCAAEVLEHLYLTYTGTTKGFQKVLAANRPVCSRSSMAHFAARLVVFGFSYLPPGRTAPPLSRPRGLSVEKVMAELDSKIIEMDEIISQCEAALGRVRLLDHPILGPLTAGQWRKFHLIHGRHHIKQIRTLRQNANCCTRESV